MYYVTPTVMTRGGPRRIASVGLMAAVFMGALAAGTAFVTKDAEARVCGPRDMIINRLNNKYEEKQSARGVAGNGMLTELYVSKLGSWTIVFTQPDGTSCLMAAGEDWEKTRLSDTDTDEDGTES